MAKKEGTTQTYGQLVLINEQKSSNKTASNTTAAREQNVRTGSPLDGGFSNNDRQETRVAPRDKLVRVVEDANSSTVSVQGAVAMAAASSNPNPVVSVAPGTLSAEGSTTGVAQVQPSVLGQATVVGSSIKTPEEIERAVTEAHKFDLQISLHSKESESLQFNALKVPPLDAKMVYNFFEEGEEIVDTQEDQSLDPLLKNSPENAPRYVNLTWEIVGVTEPVRGTAEAAKKATSVRMQSFAQKQGVFSAKSTNFINSSVKSAKKRNLIVQDGVKKKIADLHDPQQTFSAIANSSVFSNSIVATVSAEEGDSVVTQIPYEAIKKK